MTTSASILSDLLLGLVQKIPLSSVSQSAYHVLKIDARLPRSPDSAAASSTSSTATTQWIDRTFEAPLHAGSKAFLHVRSRVCGDAEELVVQALRVAESVRPAAVIDEHIQQQQQQQQQQPQHADVTAHTLYQDVVADAKAAADRSTSDNSARLDSVDSRLTTTSSNSSLTPAASVSDARARNAFRVVYQLRLRDTSAVGVEAYAVDLDTSSGGFSMLWSHEMREKHLHSDPRLRELAGTVDTPLLEAMSDSTGTLKTEQLTAPRLELAALNQRSLVDAHLLEDWSVLAADSLDHEATPAAAAASDSATASASSRDTSSSERIFNSAAGVNVNAAEAEDDGSSDSSLAVHDESESDSSSDSEVSQFQLDEPHLGSSKPRLRTSMYFDPDGVLIGSDIRITDDNDNNDVRPSPRHSAVGGEPAKPATFFYNDDNNDNNDLHHKQRAVPTPASTVASDSAYFEDDEDAATSAVATASAAAAAAAASVDGTPQRRGHGGSSGEVRSNATPVSSPHLSLATTHDWSAEFHDILEESEPGVRVRKMAQFARHFTHAATRIAKAIVAEEHLPPDRRTVVPVVSMRGVAGGEKFVANNMFLKFARDAYELYGSEELAAKAASLELHGLNAIMNARVRGVFMPMMCTVDDMGARIVAASVLPIGAQTLLHGVDDGGVGLRSESRSASSGGGGGAGPRSKSMSGFRMSTVRERIRSVARVLNLKEHKLRGTNETVHFGSDVEWHVSWNDRLYVVDCARVFPPEATSEKQSRSDHLVKQLRAELVARFGKPLNPDAFSAFLDQSDRNDNQEVAQATQFLLQRVVPDFAHWLYHDLDGGEAETDKPLDSQRLVREMHARGINLRLLGRVRYWLRQVALQRRDEPGAADAFERMRSLSVSQLVSGVNSLARSTHIARTRCEQATLCEMVARALVALIRSAWRACRKTSAHARTQCKRVAVTFFNFLFVPSWMALSDTSADDPSLVELLAHRSTFWHAYDIAAPEAAAATATSAAASADDAPPPLADSSESASASMSTSSLPASSARHARAFAAANAIVAQHVRRDGIKTLVSRKYGALTLTRAERLPTSDLRDSICLVTVRNIMCRKLGLVFADAADTPLASPHQQNGSLTTSTSSLGSDGANDAATARATDATSPRDSPRRQAFDLGMSTAELPPPTPTDEPAGDAPPEPVVTEPSDAPPASTVPLQPRGGISGAGGEASPRRIFMHHFSSVGSMSSGHRSASRWKSTHAAAISGTELALHDKVPRFGYKYDDLLALEPVCKHLNYVAYYEAFACAQRALALKRRMWQAHVAEATSTSDVARDPAASGESMSPSSASVLPTASDVEALEAAAERAFGRTYAAFEETLRASPADSHALVAFARFLAEWASLSAESDDATRLWELADSYFAAAHRLSPNESYPLLNWSNQVLGSVHDFLTATALRRLSKQRDLLAGLPDRLVQEQLGSQLAPPTVALKLGHAASIDEDDNAKPSQ